MPLEVKRILFVVKIRSATSLKYDPRTTNTIVVNALKEARLLPTTREAADIFKEIGATELSLRKISKILY